MVVFKEEASLFERALLARGEHIEDDVAGGKDARQMIHRVIIGLYDALQKTPVGGTRVAVRTLLDQAAGPGTRATA